MKARIINDFYKLSSSPRLTLFLLVYSVFLVFGATLMQTRVGIAGAQSAYFESFVFLASPFFMFDNFLSHIRVPLAGGALIGSLAAINILASCTRAAKFGVQGFGVSITHMAIVLLILSGAMQYFMRTEGRIALKQDVPNNMVEVAGESKKLQLPFSISLIKFENEVWHGSDIPREYSSKVSFERDGKKSEAIISMNAPASFGGWTFFQMSYADGGKTSILGAVRNPARLLPWLSVGTAFIGMLIIFVPRLVSREESDDEK